MEIDMATITLTFQLVFLVSFLGWRRRYVWDKNLRKYRYRWYWDGQMNVAGEE